MKKQKTWQALQLLFKVVEYVVKNLLLNQISEKKQTFE